MQGQSPSIEEKPHAIRGFLDVLTKSLLKLQSRNFQKSMAKIKMAAISNDLRSMKQTCVNLESAPDRPQRKNSYSVIKPIVNEYVSFIASGDQHDYDAESKNFQDGLTNINYKATAEQHFQKHLNQTLKSCLKIEEFPISQLAQKSIGDYSTTALKAIQDTPYEAFWEEILVKKTSWGKPVDRMVYKITLGSPLTKLHPNMHSQALQTFEMIVALQNRKVLHPRCHCIAQIVNMAIRFPDQLRDQIFFQVIRQMTNNRQGLYLKLFCVMCAVVRASLRMYIPLLNYILRNQQQSPLEYNYAFYSLILNFDKPRLKGVTNYEALLAAYMKKIPVTTSFPTQQTFFMEESATVESLVSELVKFYQLDPTVNYLLYHNGCYFGSGMLMDAFYMAIQDHQPEVVFSEFTGFFVTLVVMDMGLSLNTRNNSNLLYCYSMQLYLEGKFQMGKEALAKVAALKYYSENDGLGPCDLWWYIPKKLSKTADQNNLEQMMVANIQAITCTKQEARNQALQIFRSFDSFQSYLFPTFLYFKCDQSCKLEVMLTVGKKYLQMSGSKGFSYNKRVLYTEIKKLSVDKQKLCVVTNTLGDLNLQSKHMDIIKEVVCESWRAGLERARAGQGEEGEVL